MSRRVVSVISLGCAKNLVDTEGMLAAFAERGWLIAENPRDAAVVLVNTCGFIEAAREESFRAIEDALALKERGAVRAVIVVGCLVQLQGEELSRRFSEADGWVGLTAPGDVVRACEDALAGRGAEGVRLADPATRPIDAGPRLRVAPRHYAYLRIAEGCNNRCRYCQIPAIRGPLRSKRQERIMEEAHELIADGARELMVIGQDTTNYGVDLYGERRLAALLGQLREVDGVHWVRLLYAHPAHLGDDVIGVLAEGGAVLPYLDLPVQHASDRVLEQMGRGVTGDELRRLVGRLRSAVPGLVLRTTVIVGFPGEDEVAFGELLHFLREVRFERLGAFTYSAERGTPAAGLGDTVPGGVKEERLAAVMELQQSIAAEQSAALVGTELDAVVDGRDAEGGWVGRTTRDAPDIDGTIRFDERELGAGTFGRVVVTGADGYDLAGRFVGMRSRQAEHRQHPSAATAGRRTHGAQAH